MSRKKVIVTHENPDMDAIGAVWLFRKFGDDKMQKAEVAFVKAGDTLSEQKRQELKAQMDDVVHVDTGLGQFDHHQPGNRERTSATKLVYEFLMAKNKNLDEDEALARVVDFINETDHFASVNWPEPTADRYLFGMEEMLAGLRSGQRFGDLELISFGSVCYDGVYTAMRMRVAAEEDLKTNGESFETKWGKVFAIENQNDEVVKLAMKQGYQVVVRKDHDQGNVRIKAVPDKDIDLTSVHEKIKKVDTIGTWYLHPSGTMLLNGSLKRSDQKPTPLTLREVVEIVKEQTLNPKYQIDPKL